MDPAYDDFENFNLGDQQKHQKAKWTSDIRGKLCFRKKGLQFVMALILIVLFILFIYGFLKYSQMNGSVKEFPSQVKEEISQAMTNVSHKSEMMMLKQNLEDDMTSLSARVVADMSKKLDDIMYQIMIKIREMAEIECRNLQCPTKWIAFDESCYFISNTKASWHNGQQYCSLHGGNLLVINNPNEQTFISLSTKHEYFWIGLSENGTETNWQWVDGTALNTSATDWNEGEPNNAGAGEDCVEIQIAGKWNDVNCNKKQHWICEQKRKLI
ncbi:CD209 antigen-like protein E [Amblyraja radiata]|uniref:CD209 antigen-like protein E n=1 Tax=Amblyraja radiata TaxID=386614 RepID=UPI001402DCC0|nr:CD209 antigen-like protein E [Amblyraja radiata]